jgi:hypothetical protein
MISTFGQNKIDQKYEKPMKQKFKVNTHMSKYKLNCNK